MLIHIDTADKRPIYAQIMDEVRRAVVLGTVRAEEPLPSVRQLAADLRVNPNTIQQAYRELETEGVVYKQRGRGTFVSPRSGRDDQRQRLARGVAERAVADASRNGLEIEELLGALRQLAGLDRIGTGERS